MMVTGILLIPAQPSHIEAETYEPPIRIVSGALVDQPQPLEEVKDPELTYPGEACNCWLYQKNNYFPDLPSTATIKSNLVKEIGDLAVFYYPESGLYHYAKVIWNDGYSIGLDEANFKHCQITQRVVNIDYPRLIGFYNIL